MISIVDFFSWWFVTSSKKILYFIIATIKHIYHFFSLPYLIGTLFAPWKRDISIPINPSLQEKFKAFIDNLIARLMGFIVRSMTIISGLIILFLSIIILGIFFIIWIVLPFISLGSFIYGLWIVLK